eukprot:16439159-Heterocapsa_arctica.AAC.2
MQRRRHGGPRALAGSAARGIAGPFLAAHCTQYRASSPLQGGSPPPPGQRPSVDDVGGFWVPNPYHVLRHCQ